MSVTRFCLAFITPLLIAALMTACSRNPASQAPGNSKAPAAPARTARYIGSERCAPCHQEEVRAWAGSDHAKAMQHATARTVLGDFSGKGLNGPSGVMRFFEKEGAYFVHADGEGGVEQEFPIRFTFGVYPLQQYLVQMRGGRLQALPVAWDARARKEGGQRWFSLYEGQHFSPGDPLHWTGRDQNWNFMCAACHTTGLRKNYDLKNDTYRTEWSELGVACESCHGPASAHLEWARDPARDRGAPHHGLTVSLHAARALQWGFHAPSQKIASPSGALEASWAQSDRCFPCHARRQTLTNQPSPQHAFLDDHSPLLLDAGLYHADGQIDAETFEFGSFTQSKMYARGVTCTNCHDAHSLRLRATGNALCSQCHRAQYYDRPAHHHHPEGSSGAQCVNCHMPEKTYMGVDRRRDHGFRIPRPDLTVKLGVPNACSQCHRDRDPQWAGTALKRWTGHEQDTSGHFANAIAAVWEGADAKQLLAIANAIDGTPTFVRASSLALLPAAQGVAADKMLDALAKAAQDSHPLIRLGAAKGLVALQEEDAARLGAPLLSDPIRAVRVEAARALVGIRGAFEHFESAFNELIAAESTALERPETHMNLAQIYARQGRDEDAQRELRTSLRLDANFVPAMVNLADLDRGRGREDEAERWLRKAIEVEPTSAEATHAMGLLEVRRGRPTEALGWLEKAARLEPKNARYGYVYVVALAQTGQGKKAAAELTRALQDLPRDVTLLSLRDQLGSLSQK